RGASGLRLGQEESDGAFLTGRGGCQEGGPTAGLLGETVAPPPNRRRQSSSSSLEGRAKEAPPTFGHREPPSVPAYQEEKRAKEAPEPRQSPSSDRSSEKDGTSRSSGWLGGLLNKISIRPKNQMILPDDSNPTIKWDADKKQWIDTTSPDGSLGSAPPPPPPTDHALMRPVGPSSEAPLGHRASQSMIPVPQENPGQQPQMPANPQQPTTGAGPTTMNKYKLTSGPGRGRGLRPRYVDVLNKAPSPRGAELDPNMVPVPGNTSLPIQPPTMNFFIPQ
ncbi:unnamed protein product, partial [Cyprideis torosa]